MILVLIEHENGTLKPASRELLAFARRTGQEFALPAAALILGADAAPFAAELQALGAERILNVAEPALADYSSEYFVHALKQIVAEHHPFVVASAHNARNVDFMPRLAVALRRPFVASCVGHEKIGNRLLLTRQIFNAKMNMRVEPRGGESCLLTLSPGAYPAADNASAQPPAASIAVEAVAVDFASVVSRGRTISRTAAPKGDVDLSSAAVIVAGGRGLKQKENFSLIFDLARALNGAVGASRPVVDAEWLPREYQIGSSGQTVAPRLYFAIGISGAIQHVVGMQGARCIVAINKDADAPIFKIAHYGIADDLFKVVPVLTKLLEDLKAR